ncbi:adult-specific cuticular protein ACP-20-like [Sitophilus oryzae]|uniref:Adult-specific cuticular protein ACP-20-like n=1 Tax=Sitophilus oryzae TaxID=7048 RepID=A0A6J2XVW9_SITOR|nr:adult-specific cuticular protein ACP-20-like [Sitophilus oryzae]
MNCFGVFFCLSVIVAGSLAYPDHDEDHHVPHYHFKYGVHDPHTHDHKHQKEERHHDDVKGAYSIHDPDGTHRVVKYTSDKHEGFKAEVHREGHAKHPGHHGHGKGGTSYVGVTHWGHGSGK